MTGSRLSGGARLGDRRRLFARAALCAALAGASAFAIGSPASASTIVPAKTLRAYIAQIERVRLPVNSLLETADPILNGYQDGTIAPDMASGEMGDLEERFAHYLLLVQMIHPADAKLARIDAPYAHTYLLEDAYMATLASDLEHGRFDNLPNTQDAQRLAIIVWRTQLEIVAKQDGVRLPPDLQRAGRGEIAPAIGS
jgi:hypothetical protein